MWQVPHCDRVIVSKFLASTHLFGWPAESKRFQVEGKGPVGPDAADDLAHVLVQPAPDRRNADDDSHPDHNTQDGEPRAQLVAADSLRRHAKDFTEFVLAHKNPAPASRRSASGSGKPKPGSLSYISNRSA